MTKKTPAAKVQDHVLSSLKAYAALVGSIATALLGIYADSSLGHTLTVIAAVCTAVGTWAIPNVDSDEAA